jgi:hypothetical protein
MRLGQRHRHVEVVGARGEGPLEHRHDKTRVYGIEDVGDAVLAAQRSDGVRRRRVDLGSDKSPVLAVLGDRPLGASQVVVGDHHCGEEVATGGNAHCRGPDAPGTDDENLHNVLRIQWSVPLDSTDFAV